MTNEASEMAVEEAARVWTCPEHGETYGDDPTRPSRTWECPKCFAQAQHAERQFRAQKSRYAWWRESSGVPERYRSALPGSIQPLPPSGQALARLVAAYTSTLKAHMKDGSGMLLLGPPGLGKTVALTAVVNVACTAVRGPVYVVWPDALADVKASFSAPRDDPRRQAIERLRDVPLLAIDELGVRGATDFDHGELFGLLDYRYRERLPTIVAANATPTNFALAVGERIADRLREMGPQLVLSGESRRGTVTINGPDAFPEPPASVTVRTHAHGRWIERGVVANEGW